MAADKSSDPQKDWVNAHMRKTSKDVARRLLTDPQNGPPDNAPIMTLQGVKARCIAGGASNFWIVGDDAAEPVLTGDYPLTGMSPTAYFVLVPEYNNLPYAVDRGALTAANHSIRGDLGPFEAAMREVYG